MRRAWLGAFGIIAVFSLSCGIKSAEPVTAKPLVSPIHVTLGATALHSADHALASTRQSNAVRPSDEDSQVDMLVRYLGGRSSGMTGSELHDLAVAISEEVDRQELDLRLILALMYVESRYDPFAVSPVGAMGLMQILPSTGREIAGDLGIEWEGPETLFNPAVNARIGIAYVKMLTKRYENVSTALAAYNWGMGRIDKRLRRGSPVPVVYPGLVMDAYNHAVLPVRSLGAPDTFIPAAPGPPRSYQAHPSRAPSLHGTR